jgi:hypothetical protein
MADYYENFIVSKPNLAVFKMRLADRYVGGTNMISPIAGSFVTPEPTQQPHPVPSQTVSHSNVPPQDTVSISPKGQVASADVDHDGDSH